MGRPPIEKLPPHPLLAGLEPAQQARMRASAERRELAAGESLFFMGDEARRFYVVESGQLKLYRVSPSGQEKIVELLHPPKTFAEAVMFMPERRYPVNCEALTDAAVIGLSIREFLAILEESHESVMRLLGVLSMKLRTRLADIDALSLQNATLRVVSYLLQLAPADADERAAVALPFSKKNVAARLSLQPETLSRVFARLRDQGLVEIDGPTVHISDLAALRELALRA